MELYAHIEKTFSALEACFSLKNLDCFAACSLAELEGYRTGLAAAIGPYLLGEDTPLYQSFRCAGVKHRDEMANYIITLFYFHVRTRDKS